MIVHLHSCSNIFANREVKPDVVVSVTINKKTKVSSKTVANCDPIFEDRMLILSDNPTVDDVKIDVIDMKNDKLAGSVNLELTQLLNKPDLCMFDETFYLTKKGVLTSGTVRMTVALRYLHPTSPVQGPSAQSEKDKIGEENIFDIGLKENVELLKSVGESQTEKNLKEKEAEFFKERQIAAKSIPHTGGSEIEEIVHKATKDVPAAAPPPTAVPPAQKQQQSIGYKLPKSNSINGPFTNLTKSAPNGKAKSLSKKDAGPKIHLSVKYNKTTSVVSLIVHKVANLQGVTHKKLPNPYVKTYILENLFSSNKRDVHSKKKTKTKNRTFNPVFEETLEYFVPHYDLQYHKLEVHI